MNTTEFFGTERIGKIMIKLAPPAMLAQLIQAFFKGRLCAGKNIAL